MRHNVFFFSIPTVVPLQLFSCLFKRKKSLFHLEIRLNKTDTGCCSLSNLWRLVLWRSVPTVCLVVPTLLLSAADLLPSMLWSSVFCWSLLLLRQPFDLISASLYLDMHVTMSTHLGTVKILYLHTSQMMTDQVSKQSLAVCQEWGMIRVSTSS